MDDLAELSIGGHVARPGDPDWDDSRQAWNLAADQHLPIAAMKPSRSANRLGSIASLAAS